MKKRYITFSLKIAGVFLLFLLLFRPEMFGFEGLFGNVRPMDVWRTLREVSNAGPFTFLFWMACAALVKLAGICSGILRWHLLLRGQGLRLPFSYLAYQWFMGRAIGLLLPGTLGLDGYRLLESSRYTKEVVKCATVIAVEKLTGIIALAFLVFVTFPLGFKYLPINPMLLAGVMAVLLALVLGSLLLLLNPRVIQILVAIVPAPLLVRGMVDKLGRAATAYADHKAALLCALFFGLLVHLGTCSKYFCTFMAIRAANVSAADIFFVSPLMITASVLAFTISGLGVREVAFGLVLGASAGHATAILGGHLGLWAGEIIPLVLSVPLLVLGGRPVLASREPETPAKSSVPGHVLLLTREQVRWYRRQLLSLLCCGIAGGWMAGAVVASLESAWIVARLGQLEEWGLLPWGLAAYGVVFAGIGALAAAGLAFLGLLLDRFPAWPAAFTFSNAGALFAGGSVILLFRYQRDVLSGHAMTPRDYAAFLSLASGAVILWATVVFVKADFFMRRLKFTVPRLLLALMVTWSCLWGAAAAITRFSSTDPEPVIPRTDVRSQGPGIVFIAVDTLRADFLRLYNPDAEARTPNIDQLAADGILFFHAFSQASWTKPSFATMFTGLYPEAHGATTKTAVLSGSAKTLAERLAQAGYYTKGLANNPHMLPAFGLHRGFMDYEVLKPDPLFSAPASGMQLALYGVMRKIVMVVEGKLLPHRLRATHFYQPAESVTRRALDWMGERDTGTTDPFFLFMHYMDPHDPFMDHDRPGVGYARARMENPDPKRYLEPMRRAYISEIEHMDMHLGVLFQTLKDLELYDNSVIVFVADHGEEFFDHGGWWHGQTLYEEQLRVPLIIKLPGNSHAGAVNPYIARLVDLAPTLLQQAGLEPEAALSGKSLFGADGTFANADIAYAYAENDFEGNVQQSVRSLNRALILSNENNPRGTAPSEFYDMTEDPAQQRSLADNPDYAGERASYEAVIEQYQRVIEEQAPDPAAPAEMDVQSRQQLEALGYL